MRQYDVKCTNSQRKIALRLRTPHKNHGFEASTSGEKGGEEKEEKEKKKEGIEGGGEEGGSEQRRKSRRAGRGEGRRSRGRETNSWQEEDRRTDRAGGAEGGNTTQTKAGGEGARQEHIKTQKTETQTTIGRQIKFIA